MTSIFIRQATLAGTARSAAFALALATGIGLSATAQAVPLNGHAIAKAANASALVTKAALVCKKFCRHWLSQGGNPAPQGGGGLHRICLEWGKSCTQVDLRWDHSGPTDVTDVVGLNHPRKARHSRR